MGIMSHQMGLQFCACLGDLDLHGVSLFKVKGGMNVRTSESNISFTCQSGRFEKYLMGGGKSVCQKNLIPI